MGTRRRAASGAACAQDAPKAPRMAQEARQAVHERLRTIPAPEPVLSEVWKPEALSWPERHPFDATRIDDRDRWTAAVGRYLGLVGRLCREYRREFPASKYGVSAEGGLRERVALLRQFGGLPETVECLNSVPAEVLEKAVGTFAECFGLDREDAASGHLAGTGSVPTELDPTPRNRVQRVQEPAGVPW